MIDADSHYHWVLDLRDTYIDPEFRDLFPVARPDGVVMVDGRGMSTVQFKRHAYLDNMWDTEHGKYASLGFDPHSYIKAMDDRGVGKMALFGIPNVGAWGLDPAVAVLYVPGAVDVGGLAVVLEHQDLVGRAAHGGAMWVAPSRQPAPGAVADVGNPRLVLHVHRHEPRWMISW